MLYAHNRRSIRLLPIRHSSSSLDTYAVLWFWQLFVRPSERANVLRDYADLEVFLYPQLARLRWKVRIEGPWLDRWLDGKCL